ncbi:ABC transporter substrate-binding protein [Burkholderia sp. KK1]|uniref:Aliphatic sulfonate ABC transporter periplasmic ligand-binding protein n=1 Tax=Caballeronia cordobensis TaxID=1353886 RepID=A0A158HIW1_CABCO|nr:ABC transporter substrate-binding protein [Burkholderia sp. KK1]SAL44304.1 aliphatic sulfonate ABC transporter periplasmic ligand-binding protein [Caballeronia cordobensis]
MKLLANKETPVKSLLRFICTGLLALCASHPAFALAPEPAPLPQPVTLTIGYVKVGHLAPMLSVADTLKKLNVIVKPVEFVRYADARTALLSGSVDIGAVGPGDLPIVLAQGNTNLVGLTGVAASSKYLVVRKGVQINDWKDIEGKRIGIAPGSAVWFQWAATLTEKGIPYKSFTAVNIQGGGTAFVQALKRGDIDAFLCWEPFESQVVSSGDGYFAKQIEYGHSKAVGAELGMLAATSTAMSTKREAIQRFLWAYLNAQDTLAKDPEAFAQAYSRYVGLPLDVTRPSVKLIQLGGVLDAAQIKAQATEFHKLGVIPKDVSGEVGKYYDDSLVKSLQRGGT